MSNSNRNNDIEFIMDAAQQLGRLPEDVTPEEAREEIESIDRRKLKRLRRQAHLMLRERNLART